MNKLLTMTFSLLASITFSEQIPGQIINASKRMPEIMNEPKVFLDVVDDMSFSNRVIFVHMVDKASNALPGPEDERDDRNEKLSKYYFIATNTPYLNVPVVANSSQSGQILLSQLQFLQKGTNTLNQQKTDRTNVVYKANANVMDFDFMNPLDADIKLIFDDSNHVAGSLKNLKERRRDKIDHHEVKPYYGQSW